MQELWFSGDLRLRNTTAAAQNLRVVQSINARYPTEMRVNGCNMIRWTALAGCKGVSEGQRCRGQDQTCSCSAGRASMLWYPHGVSRADELRESHSSRGLLRHAAPCSCGAAAKTSGVSREGPAVRCCTCDSCCCCLAVRKRKVT